MEVLLTETGLSPVAEFSEADVVIVNTCGFIDAAVTESLQTLRKLSRQRKRGGVLIAAGCLAQREGDKLTRKVPGIDAVLGSRSWPEIARVVELVTGERARKGRSAVALLDAELQLGGFRRKPRPGSAYVKISDGCDSTCSFCIIPSIKGSYRSKPREQVLEEVRQLADGGAMEIVLIGQDTTAYGLDRGEKDGLAGLLRSITSAVPRLPWLRVLYQYPQRITPGLLSAIAESAAAVQVCGYSSAAHPPGRAEADEKTCRRCPPVGRVTAGFDPWSGNSDYFHSGLPRRNGGRAPALAPVNRGVGARQDRRLRILTTARHPVGALSSSGL